MKTMNFKMAAMLAGAAAFAFTSVAQAAPNNRAGASRSSAKSSVNRGGGGAGKQAGSGNYAGGGKGGGKNRGGNNNVNINKNNNVNVNTGGRNGYNNGNGNRGNTVVVAPGRGGYNNGYNNGWDNDDNDFLEFVGKTAAITAGVSVVAAVIGSTTNDKPDDCQQSVSNGQVYMYCNGTWYQPIQNGSQTQYQVIAPPR